MDLRAALLHSQDADAASYLSFIVHCLLLLQLLDNSLLPGILVWHNTTRTFSWLVGLYPPDVKVKEHLGHFIKS